MANDIAPELYEKIKKDITEELEKSAKAKELYNAVASGKADYTTANLFSEEIGSIYSRALKNNLNSGVLPDGKMYYNIAERTIRPAMEECYGKISDVTFRVQSDLNRSAGIGIKAIKPELNNERVEGIINRSCTAEHFDDVSWLLDEPIVNFAQSVVDDFVKVNADFHERAGLAPTITRTVSGKCCKWCESLAGTYDYKDAPDDIYRRHESCRCQVLYNPGDSKKYQNVHTKKWVDSAESKKIEQRKNTGSKITTSSNSIPKGRDNKSVREWYINEVSRISNNVDKSLPLAEQAKQAFEERNKLRIKARNFMDDVSTRKELDRTRPVITFEELIESKMKRKGLTYNEAVEDILKTATTTNEQVNKEFGFGGKSNGS